MSGQKAGLSEADRIRRCGREIPLADLLSEVLDPVFKPAGSVSDDRSTVLSKAEA